MRFRFTIARFMVTTAILAINAGLARSFAVHGNFSGGILIFITLQIALWCFLRGQGVGRRFWLGFEIGGVGSVLALIACETVPALTRLLAWYVDVAFRLQFSYLPARIDDVVMEHQDWFLALVYFLPELLAAVLGGIVIARLGSRRSIVRRQSISQSRREPGEVEIWAEQVSESIGVLYSQA